MKQATQMAITEVRVMGESGQEYWVRMTGDEPTCTCLAFAFNDGPCKHMKFVASQFA